MRSFIFTAAACLLAASPSSFAAEQFLIRAEKVYTAPDARAKHPAVVVIKDGLIDGVWLPVAISGKEIPECNGGFITAGFQNSHVHFTEATFADAAKAPAAKLTKSLSDMLTRYGYTTVFDTGSDQANTFALRKRVQKGEVIGPRIFSVGLPLFPPDGIPSYINDLPPEVLARLHQPRTTAEAKAAVRANMAAGADATKLFLHTSPRQGAITRMSPEIARAAVEETHAHGKLVLAHPTSLEAIRVALDAGVDVLVHTTLGEQSPWDADTLARMKAANMSVIPTFKLWLYELKKENVPANVVDMLVGSTLKELTAFQAAGGQILFGTDVGYMHDYDPTAEYELMAKAGMTAPQILASLTTAPAARWKEDQQRGRVDRGFAADLVVLGGDPMVDVKNFANVKCVFRGGKLIYSAATKAP
jgi:imidazolonepropionase-like amidohydrolase